MILKCMSNIFIVTLIYHNSLTTTYTHHWLNEKNIGIFGFICFDSLWMIISFILKEYPFHFWLFTFNVDWFIAYSLSNNRYLSFTNSIISFLLSLTHSNTHKLLCFCYFSKTSVKFSSKHQSYHQNIVHQLQHLQMSYFSSFWLDSVWNSTNIILNINFPESYPYLKFTPCPPKRQEQNFPNYFYSKSGK